MTTASQRETILDLLKQRGALGVSARELVYDRGITRSAARIWELRQAGHEIVTTGSGRMATYRLGGPVVKPYSRADDICACDHFRRHHVSGTSRCMADEPQVPGGYCVCQRFVLVGIP